MSQVIPNQVRLPFTVAFDVVRQGIRVRLGRSVVTLLGVGLGIAFLMNTFASQILDRAVIEERQVRAEVDRMTSFLTAEVGTVNERSAALVIAGPLSQAEARFLRKNADAGLVIRAVDSAAAANAAGRPLPSLTQTTLADLAKDASVVLVLGDGPVPSLDWTALLGPARQRVVAVTHPGFESVKLPEGASYVELTKPPAADEVQEQKDETRRQEARNLWIMIIAMSVTAISIANAMLMSVTERFREIGTMRCLGAVAGFIRQIFLIESCLIGAAGATLGAVAGCLFCLYMYCLRYDTKLVLSTAPYGLLLGATGIAIIIGLVLSILAALYPARVASRMVPAHALRTNV